MANDVSKKDSGFEVDTNVAKIIRRDGKIEDTGLIKKEDLANLILDRVKEIWNERRNAKFD